MATARHELFVTPTPVPIVVAHLFRTALPE